MNVQTPHLEFDRSPKTGVVSDVLVYGIGEVASKLVAVVTLVISARVLGPSDFGLLSLILAIATFFAVLTGFGGESTYMRFFFDQQSREQQSITTSTWLFGSAAVIAFAIALAYAAKATLADLLLGDERHSNLLIIGIASVLVVMMNGICGQGLRNMFLGKRFVAINLANGILGLLLTLYVIFAVDRKILGLLVAGLLAATSMLPVRLWFVRDLVTFRFDAARFGAMAKYGVGLVFAGIFYTVMALADRWMLARLVNVAEVGSYSVAAMLAGLMNLILVAVGQAWWPRLLMEIRDHPGSAPALAADVLTYIVFGFSVMAVGLAAVAAGVVTLLFTPDFARAAGLVGPLAFGVVFYASNLVTAAWLAASHRSNRLIPITAVAAIANVALNAISIPKFGAMGAAWSAAVSYLLMTSLHVAVTQSVWPVPFQWSRVVPVCTLAAIWIAGFEFLEFPSAFVKTTIGVLGWAVFVFAGALITGIKPRQVLDVLRSESLRLRRAAG